MLMQCYRYFEKQSYSNFHEIAYTKNSKNETLSGLLKLLKLEYLLHFEWSKIHLIWLVTNLFRLYPAVKSHEISFVRFPCRVKILRYWEKKNTSENVVLHDMMTSSDGNIFRVTGPLCGEFTGPGEFPTQRPVTRSFDVFFDLRLNKRLSKQTWGWWFETPSWSLWRQCNGDNIMPDDDLSAT